MSTESNPLPSDLGAQEPSGLQAASRQAPVKQEWETPELKIMPMQETESGWIYATKEATSFPTQMRS